MKLFKNNKGFTLVELIVVIVILGVLGAVAAPKVLGSIKTSKVNAVITNVKTVERVAAKLFIESPTSTAPTALAIGTEMGKIPAGFTVTSCTVSGTGGATTLSLVLTLTPATLGVTLADLTAAGTNASLSGTFATVAAGITYTNASLQ